MKVLGFRELDYHHAPAGPSLRKAVRGQPHPQEPRILTYLRSGVCFAVCPMVVGDCLDPKRDMVSTAHCYTDGEWVWRGDVAWYVQEHHAELPAEFINRMESLGWSVPALPQGRISEVETWWSSEQS